MGFDHIYQDCFSDVFHYLCGLTGDHHLAEELTQETFFKALKALDQYDGRKDIRAWLFTIGGTPSTPTAGSGDGPFPGRNCGRRPAKCRSQTS